ncbi:MAG: hypothetical protein ACREMA_18415, partial [Longimicrobiales bacterium]
MPTLFARPSAHAHSRRLYNVAALAIIITLFQSFPLTAQTTPPAGTLLGRVLDAGTSQAVPAATVTLEPATSGLLVDPRGAVVMATVRTIVTGESGAYRFTDVAP